MKANHILAGEIRFVTKNWKSSGSPELLLISNTKSPTNLSYTFTTPVANAGVNVSTLPGYNPGAVNNVTITVNPGVYLYATSTASAGLSVTGVAGTDVVTIVNNGYIMGQGGTGGGSNPGGSMIPPTAGGPALSLSSNVTITGSGYIAGGGGGGAGGKSAYECTFEYSWGGGGGGAGGGMGGSIAFSGTGATGYLSGGAGGGPGSSGANGQASSTLDTGGAPIEGGGGGGGRILPGNSTASISPGPGIGGTAGGSGSSSYWIGAGGFGGGGNSAGSAPANGWDLPGGGGGWGAAGGSSGTIPGTSHITGTINVGTTKNPVYENTYAYDVVAATPGAGGGLAIQLNGHTAAYSGQTIYGAIA